MASGRTFSESGGSVYAGLVRTGGLILALSGIVCLISPLRWGTGVAGPLVGIVLVAVSIPAFRWSRHLRQLGVRAGPDGVEVIGVRGVTRLTWDQVRGFTPGLAPAVTIAGKPIPAVYIQLVNGHEMLVEGLRVDPGLGPRSKAEERVQELCRQLEALRPRAAVAG